MQGRRWGIRSSDQGVSLKHRRALVLSPPCLLECDPLDSVLGLCFYSFIYLFIFRAAPAACGGSQARGQIGAVAAGLQPQQHGIRAVSATYTTAHGNS